MSDKLVAIDPGKRSTGYAIFEGGFLVDCGVLSGKKAALLRVADAPLVIECPKVYPMRNNTKKASPNQLIVLAVLVGEIKALYQKFGTSVIFPQDWKGSVPKHVSHSRVRKVLSLQERKLLDQLLEGIARTRQHDVLDAVGIGLWKLGRKYNGSNKNSGQSTTSEDSGIGE
jgi:hypothetical protein